MNFTTLTTEQAHTYRDHVLVREPLKLTDLANFLDASGGPLDELDASLDSLIPLWRWFMSSLDSGATCVPGGLEVSVTAGDVTEAGSLDPERVSRRARYLGRCIEHYLLLVCRRLDPSAHWAVYEEKIRRGVDVDYHSTCIRLSGGQMLRVSRMMATMTSNVLDDNALQRQPDRLRHLLLSWGRGGLPDVHQKKANAVLRPYLAVPAAVDDPRRSVPRFDGIVPPVLPKPVPSPMGELDSELILAAGPAEGLEDPSLLRSLPETPIADALNRLGFTTVEDGQAITAELLRASDGEFRHRDEMADVTTAIHDHRLRALFIEDTGASPQEWKNLHRSLKELASSVDAYLGPEDTWV